MRKLLLLASVALLVFANRCDGQIPVDVVHVVNSPNVLAWPMTTQITRLELRATGVHVEFDKRGSWPDVTPPGWGGPLQYTLWLFLRIGDEWYASGIIQFWRGLEENGGDVTSERQIARNWVYDARWSAMINHQPTPGERVGFMVSSGNARGQDDHVVAERSNIVEIAFPQTPTSFPPFLWSELNGSPVVTPPPAPPPVVIPPPLPSVDWSVVLNQMAVNQSSLMDRIAELKTDVAAVKQDIADFRAAVRSKLEAFVKSPWVQAIGAGVVGYIAKGKR